MKTGPLQSQVKVLRQFLSESIAQGDKTPQSVRDRADALKFPEPELAAQVFKFLNAQGAQAAGAGPQAQPLSNEAVSEAFMALLMDGEAVAALGAGKTKNPWLNIRAVLRNTGHNLGTSLLDVYNIVRQTGLGYTPTILELSALLKELFNQLKGATGEAAMRQVAGRMGLSEWQIALAAAWMRRKRGVQSGEPPTDSDLEEIFADRELMKELSAIEGPWEVYVNQGEALRTLRHFGESLEALADAVED